MGAAPHLSQEEMKQHGSCWTSQPIRTQGATIDKPLAGVAKLSLVFLRLTLGISFLSVVADRFGLWGAYRQTNVSWGNAARFVDYTAKLNWFLPVSTIPALANMARLWRLCSAFFLSLVGRLASPPC